MEITLKDIENLSKYDGRKRIVLYFGEKSLKAFNAAIKKETKKIKGKPN
jgi:hypothetical protein